jgi:hypothetical protein
LCARRKWLRILDWEAHTTVQTALQIDTFSDGKLNKTPSLGGLFGHIGARVFITKHIGVGGEISWRPSQADYAGIQYRPTFYTVDAIYRPPKGSTKKLAPELRAGIGGVRLHFFPVDDPSCAQVPGCPSSNHFRWHFAAAARWYLTDHLFFRPALDLHYVNYLSEFGSNLGASVFRWHWIQCRQRRMRLLRGVGCGQSLGLVFGNEANVKRS